MNLDLRGAAVSTGAACSSGSPEPSPVLLALGLTPAAALEAGANEYVMKPFTKDILKEKLELVGVLPLAG